jgi:uncharacterized protein (TIGR03435 family)
MMPHSLARHDTSLSKHVRVTTGLMCVTAALMVASPSAVSTAIRQSTQVDTSTALVAARFESASVKRGAKTRPTPGGRIPLPFPTPAGARFSATTVTLRELILRAYEIRSYQLAGGPDWQRSDYFDVTATVGRDATGGEVNALLRTLLAERFGLRTHTETRQAPQYAMTIERSDGRLGRGLARTSPECEALLATVRQPADLPRPSPPRGIPPPPICGVVQHGSTPQGSTFGFSGRPLWVLVEMVSYETAMPVVDHTGLSGLFDVALAYKPIERPRNPPPPGTPLADQQFRSAVREQLGLQLELVNGPLQVVVIDDVRPPIPD